MKTMSDYREILIDGIITKVCAKCYGNIQPWPCPVHRFGVMERLPEWKRHFGRNADGLDYLALGSVCTNAVNEHGERINVVCKSCGFHVCKPDCPTLAKSGDYDGRVQHDWRPDPPVFIIPAFYARRITPEDADPSPALSGGSAVSDGKPAQSGEQTTEQHGEGLTVADIGKVRWANAIMDHDKKAKLWNVGGVWRVEHPAPGTAAWARVMLRSLPYLMLGAQRKSYRECIWAKVYETAEGDDWQILDAATGKVIAP